MSASMSHLSPAPQPLPQRRFVVGVMGSGSKAHHHLSVPLGEWLGHAGVDVLTGGGMGVMEAVSGAFARVKPRKGLVIGVIPGKTLLDGTVVNPSGYPNEWVELPIQTHLSGMGDSEAMTRNHINILTSGVVVALPGGEGTAHEVRLARKYRKPVVAYMGSDGEIVGLRLDEEGVPVARTLEEVQRAVSLEMLRANSAQL
ncbi:hypothetical protein BSKO_11976 [Bryopsis sp. KO-2023]|nr:hypothetical protein BSKO_11976 [Bryopsis sp. KO-2023]